MNESKQTPRIGPDGIRGCGIRRTTRETDIELDLLLAPGRIEVDTGIGFLDHMLSSFAHHAGWSLRLRCSGDLNVDDHHSVEDCAITLGIAMNSILGSRRGLVRFGWAYAPLDESLARAVVDLVERPFAVVDLDLKETRIGSLQSCNLEHFLTSFALNARVTLHVEVLSGENGHHKAEAAFKALALALRQAIAQEGAAGDVSSAKGSVKLDIEPYPSGETADV